MLHFYISQNLDIQICEPTIASSFAWFPGRLSNLNQIFNRRPNGNLPSCKVDPACRSSHNPSISSSLHQQTFEGTVTVVLHSSKRTRTISSAAILCFSLPLQQHPISNASRHKRLRWKWFQTAPEPGVGGIQNCQPTVALRPPPTSFSGCVLAVLEKDPRGSKVLDRYVQYRLQK